VTLGKKKTTAFKVMVLYTEH